jgi:hypothetical protein
MYTKMNTYIIQFIFPPFLRYFVKLCSSDDIYLEESLAVLAKILPK